MKYIHDSLLRKVEMTFFFNENFIYDNVETLIFALVLLRSMLTSKIDDTTINL